MPFKKILVLHDGSVQSDRALEKAIELGMLTLEGIEVILLHLVPQIPIPTKFDRPIRSPKNDQIITLTEYVIEVYEVMQADALEMLNRKKDKNESPRVGIRTKVIIGSPNRILEFAESEKVDLIVVGSVRIGNRIARLIRTFGSVSRSVSERAHCPVMIIH